MRRFPLRAVRVEGDYTRAGKVLNRLLGRPGGNLITGERDYSVYAPYFQRIFYRPFFPNLLPDCNSRLEVPNHCRVAFRVFGVSCSHKTLVFAGRENEACCDWRIEFWTGKEPTHART